MGQKFQCADCMKILPLTKVVWVGCESGLGMGSTIAMCEPCAKK